MEQVSLLLDPERRALITDFFEPRAEAVDRGDASIQEGIAFLQERLLNNGDADVRGDGPGPNANLAHVAQVIATVAWSDMSSAFSLWCQRMVLEYLSRAPADSVLRTEVMPQLLRTTLLGSTALAAAVAHYISQAPLPVVGRREQDEIVLNGRIHWASNLFQPDFVLVTAVASADGHRPMIVAVPGNAEGICVDPYPKLLALQATRSSSLTLTDVRISPEWIVTEDFDGFITSIRPPFLLLQSSFCWGLAHRALTQARSGLRGVAEVFRGDLEALETELARLAERICASLHSRGQAVPIQDVVRLRLDCARLVTAAVALEAKVVGGRGYVTSSPTARRLREAAFVPIQSPTEGQLRWELSRYA